MTVKELINKLLDAPMEAVVMVGNEEPIEGSSDSGIELVKVEPSQYAKGGAYVSIEVTP
jgi:hypothetical protein